MPELANIRALLRDRMVRDGALGTCDSIICLDNDLVDRLNELKADRGVALSDTTINGKQKDVRLVPEESTGATEPSNLDVEIEAAEQAVRDTSVRIIFRALSSIRYQGVLNEHPDANDEGLEPFLRDLVAACYHECRTLDGEKTDLTWDELTSSITYGEYEPISVAVLGINRRKVDVPFSSKPLKTIR